MERKGCGCATGIMVWVIVILLILLGVGFVLGPIGANILGLETPSSFDVSKPHFQLPAEELFHVGPFSITNTLMASWLTILVLVVTFYIFTRKMKLIPGRLQGIAEMAVEGLLNFMEGPAGKKNARLFFPLVATIFIYVIANAYLGLMPFFGPVGIIESDGSFVPLLRPANTDINLTLSIAIMSFVFVETWGMRSSGVFRYMGQFFNVGQIGRGIKQLFKGRIRPALGNVGLGFINLFVGLLELLSHFIRIISFTFRLFGNMTAGEILLLVVGFLIPLVAIIPFYGLELLVGFIQALIFAGLTLVFGIIAVAPMHEGEEQEA